MGWVIMIFLLINVLFGIYAYRIGLWIFKSRRARVLYTIVFVCIALLFPIGRLISRQWPAFFGNDLLVLLGSYSIILMLYLFLYTVFLDIIYYAFRVFTRNRNINFTLLRKICGYSILALTIITVVYGSINARRSIVTNLQLESDKISSPVSIVLVTDVHLGRIIGKEEARAMARKINALHPDIILIGGDLFDESLYSVVRDYQGDYLMMLNAPLGVFAVTGNHEYIGGIDEAVNYMKSHGIKVLRDQAVHVGPFLLTGREDLRGFRTTGIQRKNLNEMLKDAKSVKNSETIVLDHQPAAIRESINSKAFLHLSGHTHHGQFWPLGLFLPFMYEVSKGSVRIDETNIYVSSGYGTWGPPVRVGTSSEIVKIVITPKGSSGKK